VLSTGQECNEYINFKQFYPKRGVMKSKGFVNKISKQTSSRKKKILEVNERYFYSSERTELWCLKVFDIPT
jgi:hypothetical protein